MEEMTSRELVLWLADNFHDWIDGDDPVETYTITNVNNIFVKFESGHQFIIGITEVYE